MLRFKEKNLVFLNHQELKIIHFLKDNDGKIKTKKDKKILGVEEGRVREILKKLVDKRFVVKKGKGLSTFYEMA